MTMLKWAAVPLALALCAPVSAGPQTKAPDLVVTASPREVALAKWSQRVEQNLQENMRFPQLLAGSTYKDALVEVSFVCSEDGTPGKVAIARSSGDGRYDQAALRSVRRIKSLHPMAEGMEPGQAVRAQMLYITAYEPITANDLKQRTAALREDARKRNAWFTQGETAANAIVLTAAAN